MTGLPESHAPKPAGLGLWVRLRTYFLAGILISAPVGLTIYLAWKFISWVDETVFGVIPVQYNPETYLPFSIPGIGLIIIVVALTMLGALTAGLLGRLAQQVMESVLNRLPIIRTVYNALKQVIETVLANQSAAFRECVLVQYPRQGVWAIGFITGTTAKEIRDHMQVEVLNVFVPTAPNPTSGFLLFVPRSDVIFLKMSVEDGIKLVISSGIVAPPEAKLEAKSTR